MGTGEQNGKTGCEHLTQKKDNTLRKQKIRRFSDIDPKHKKMSSKGFEACSEENSIPAAKNQQSVD